MFFFFQAEDGIRDLIVTGVQTCALPISRSTARPRRCRKRRAGPAGPSRRATATGSRRASPAIFDRSEERRVGKECRARWGREDWKEKKRRGGRESGMIECVVVSRERDTR